MHTCDGQMGVRMFADSTHLNFTIAWMRSMSGAETRWNNCSTRVTLGHLCVPGPTPSLGHDLSLGRWLKGSHGLKNDAREEDFASNINTIFPKKVHVVLVAKVLNLDASTAQPRHSGDGCGSGHICVLVDEAISVATHIAGLPLKG